MTRKGDCEKCGVKCGFGFRGFSVQNLFMVGVVFIISASSVSPQLVHCGVNVDVYLCTVVHASASLSPCFGLSRPISASNIDVFNSPKTTSTFREFSVPQ